MKKQFGYNHIIGFADTNAMGNVYFANYISWQGKCRELFLRANVPGVLAEIETGKLSLITIHCSCNFLSELSAFDEVLVGMTLDSIQHNRVKMLFKYYKIVDGTEQVVATGSHEIGCFRRTANGLEIIPVPTLLQKALQEYCQ